MATKRFKVVGTKWRDSSGNTYHKAHIYDKQKGVQYTSAITYGYDTQYKQTAQALLKSKGYRVKLTSLNTDFDGYYVKSKKDL